MEHKSLLAYNGRQKGSLYMSTYNINCKEMTQSDRCSFCLQHTATQEPPSGGGGYLAKHKGIQGLAG